jgi:CO/xanthine dehydrogenase FAD-binding subunit
MPAFEYLRPGDVAGAVATVSGDPGASYLAGGTTQLDLMLKDGVLQPERLVDIGRLPLRGITRKGDTLRVGALTTMEELAADPVVSERVPFVREALLAGASPQLRNMATIGGNLLQRTRCRYFRDPAVAACNKRLPGSGCAALTGAARMHAILGTSTHCIALHASDLCVPLAALDADVHIRSAAGQRTVLRREEDDRHGTSGSSTGPYRLGGSDAGLACGDACGEAGRGGCRAVTRPVTSALPPARSAAATGSPRPGRAPRSAPPSPGLAVR